MGEYYRIINLDKQEFLDPSVFGDGLKLMEFTQRSNGVLQAQAVLTDTSPGEIHRVVYTSEPDFEPKPGETVISEFVDSPRNRDGWLPNGETCVRRMIGPECAGRWAGDRVITAGEYTLPYKFLTKVQQLRGQAIAVRWKREDILNHPQDYPPTVNIDKVLQEVDFNIYHYAGWCFKNISEEVKEQLRMFDVGRSTEANFGAIAERMLRNCLFIAYPHTITTGKGKRTRHKWDLSWMNYQCLDSFLIMWESRAEFTRAKTWLRQQHLLTWQKELIKAYKFQVRPDIEVIRHILVFYGQGQYERVERPEEYTPLLPSKPYLDAALKLERAVKNNPETATIAADGTQTRLAESLRMPVRQRVITID